MTDWLWRWSESRLRRALPHERVGPVLSDLADDHAAHRQRVGAARANVWLIRETRSLAKAYRRRDLQTWISSIGHDGWYAVRSFNARPWSFLSAVGMLGLAIGITTAMFTIVDALIIRPVPFTHPEQLARVFVGPFAPTRTIFGAWRRSGVFPAIEGADADNRLIATDAGDVVRNVALVTPGVFNLVGGVVPIRGRLFDEADGESSRNDRALLSEDMWRSQFASDPMLVGRRIEIDHESVVVVGILPSEFRFPDWNTMAWRATSFDAIPPMAGDRLTAFARFRSAVPDVRVLQTAARVATAADATNGNRPVIARPLVGDELDSQFKRAVPLLIWSVVLLFVVLSANAGGLQLTGLNARASEFGMRSALGASRSRLVRQAALESGLIGVGGIVAGAVLALALVTGSRSILPQAALLHSLNPLNLDLRAIIVTSFAGLVATIAAGALPAFVGTRVKAGRTLSQAGRGGTESAGARRITRALLVCQIALSCTLLIGATWLVRSFIKLAGADRGFDTGRIVVAAVEIPNIDFKDSASQREVMRALEERAQAIPDVVSTSWSYYPPPHGSTTYSGQWTSDVPNAVPVPMDVHAFSVDGRYFDMFGIPIVRGRSFQDSDAPDAAVVSERLAQALWPGVDPIGRRFSLANRGQRYLTAVGVAKEIRFPALDRNLDAPQIYTRFSTIQTQARLSIRCRASAGAGAGGCLNTAFVQQQLYDAHPGARIDNVRALDADYFREVARPRASAALALSFAVTAVLATTAGLFSLLTSSVARRRREFGIRLALGATLDDVRRLVWLDGLMPTLIGAAIGTLASLWAGRLLTGMLYEVGTTDAASWSIVAGTLAFAVTAASSYPARLAARTTPVTLLRED